MEIRETIAGFPDTGPFREMGKASGGSGIASRSTYLDCPPSRRAGQFGSPKSDRPVARVQVEYEGWRPRHDVARSRLGREFSPCQQPSPPSAGSGSVPIGRALAHPAEFDRARFREGWRYELINGVLVVSPTPSRKERDPNEELGYWLRHYQDEPSPRLVAGLDAARGEIETKQNRRRADRAIWAGLGRDPEEGEAPTIIVEFVSSGKVNQERDYVAKRAEYREIGVREYWVIDRFRRTLTVYIFSGESDQERVIPEKQTYETPLLPGFELPLARLLSLADRWAKKRR